MSRSWRERLGSRPSCATPTPCFRGSMTRNCCPPCSISKELRTSSDSMAHHDSRPPIVEIEAVNRAIFFAEATGGWVHIVHLSTPGAAELVKQAKVRGVQVTAETCPQYLALDHDDLVRLAGFAKCAPAIRGRDQVEQLWGYLADGTLDCITSDHCGYTVESKERGHENIW